MDVAHFAPWSISSALCRNVELGRIEVSSGRLAIRDLYDLDRPQVTLMITPGNYRVWSTELDIHAKPRTPLFRPAYLSIQLSDTPPTCLGSPDDLYTELVPPYGISVWVDLGMILIHDAESLLSADDMEALDMNWGGAWESDRDYSEVFTSVGSKIITCKTVIEKNRCPVVASYDDSGQPVAIHVDFGVLAAAQATLRTSESRAQRWGAVAGRMFPRLFRQR